MRFLILTVGLPKSGKSSWAMKQGWPVVNPDSIRLAVHGRLYDKIEEGIVWWTAHQMVEALFISGHTHVILDATNIKQHRRDEWLCPVDFPIRTSWETRFVRFSPPTSVCRDRATRMDFPVEVINRMQDEFEPLSQEEMNRLWRAYDGYGNCTYGSSKALK